MNNDSTLFPPEPRRDVVALPVIWLAVIVSLLLHGAALWGWHFKPPDLDKTQAGDTQQRLRLRLAPPTARPTAPPPTARAKPRERPAPETKQRTKPQPAPSKPVPRTPQPPVMALNAPAPVAVAPPSPPPSPASPPSPPTPPQAAPRPPAPQGDFSAMLEANRRARAAGQDPNAQRAEDENARRNRIAAANLSQPQSQVFGYDPSKSGGVFQIERMGFDSAEFLFFGWNQDIKRRTAQRIEVRKGNNPDMRTAIVRRMIAIIREHEQGDFVWHSNRLGRDITLSARPADNAGLEDVMMREFFGS
jgi:hypothetical protein